ncbi:MAG TPA: hypothetical protein VGD49_02355, partial [Longimicrobiales bacterium]
PVFQALRSGKPSGKCGACEYRSVCGGCRARAYARTGDIMASDDSCSYEPAGNIPVLEPATAVSYGSAVSDTLPWDADAQARMQRIPSFVRAVVMSRVEQYARERGLSRVSAQLISEVRQNMPVDFSKQRPFFLRGDA